MKHTASSGMVLVTVLWTVALLSALAMAASMTFRGFNGIVEIDRDRLMANGLLTAGVEVAAGLIQSAGEKPLTDTERTVSMSAGSIHLRLADEGGRIDIGQAPVEVLTALFRAVGAPGAVAVAQQIVQWRQSNGGSGSAPSQQGAGTSSSTAPAADTKQGQGQPFADVWDLMQVPGMQSAWVAAVAPLATVFGHETVNPLTAPPDVLAAMPGVSRPQLAAFLASRRLNTTDASKLIPLLGAAQTYLDAKPTQAVSVQVTATVRDGYRAGAEMVIVCLKGDAQPYRILAWKPLSAGMSEFSVGY